MIQSLLIEMTWDQWLILLTGPTAIFFSQSRYKELNKWACILGLIGQGGWFYTLYLHEQWGAFYSSFFYTYAWLVGFRNWWIRK